MNLVRFPPGEWVLAGKPFGEGIFGEIDQLLSQGHCPEGRVEIESRDIRLTCLVHRSVPHLAGLLEQGEFSWVPLKEFPQRAAQMEESVCGVMRADAIQVLLAAVHFRNRPELQASTELVDLEHVLDVLATEGQDAALALERDAVRTLLFLQKGKPARLYFGTPTDDPGEGDIRERFLLFAFDPARGPARVEVFKRLNIVPDPDAGTSLVDLARAAKPPPPVTLQVRLGGRVVLQRPFMPPRMRIGRDPTSELQLDNLSVSRRHACLFWDRGRFVIEDLGSSNGTTINGLPVEDKKPVAPLDRIGIGKFEITLAEEQEVQHPDATMIMTESQEVPAYLVGEDISVPLAQEITIGKAAGVDVRARGLFVKPVHARLRPEHTGSFRITSTGNHRVVVNGHKVQSAVLRVGDRLEIGRSTFSVVPTLSAEPTGA